MPRPLALSVLALSIAAASPAPAAPGIQVHGLFRDKAIVSIDGRRHVLTTDRPGPQGVRLIRSDSREAVIEIDGRRHTLGLSGHIGSTFTAPAETPAVHVAPDPRGMYRVSGQINGFAVEFLVDTGATNVSMNRTQARRLGIDYRMIGREGLASTANGLTRVWLVELDRVRVGDIELRNVAASVHDDEFPTTVLLGMSFLGRLEMVRDGRIMKLRRKY